jgi:hypothetical protein
MATASGAESCARLRVVPVSLLPPLPVPQTPQPRFPRATDAAPSGACEKACAAECDKRTSRAQGCSEPSLTHRQSEGAAWKLRDWHVAHLWRRTGCVGAQEQNKCVRTACVIWRTRPALLAGEKSTRAVCAHPCRD